MIVDRRLSFRSVTLSVRRENLVFFALSLLVTFFYQRFHLTMLSIASTPFTILGAAITIFLGFRTNTAYDRWWEARNLWGGLVNQSRTLIRQAITFSGALMVDATAADEDATALPESLFVRRMAHLQTAFAHSVRTHLRQQDILGTVESYLSPADKEALRKAPNVPLALLSLMARELRRAHRANLLDTLPLMAMDSTLGDMTDILGGCERIKNTPLPRQYDTVPQFAIYIYSLFLPLGLVSGIGWWTPFVSSMITFLFIAIDSIGSNIEDPFENRIHDVPMTALCRTIEMNLCQMTGEKNCPAPLEPAQGVLY